MNTSRALCRVGLLCPVLCFTLVYVACNYTRPGMYIDVVNNSGAALQNIEVDYPGGTYGLTNLAPNQKDHHWAQISPPCRFSLRLQDHSGHALPERKFEIGSACPKEIAFEIDAQYNISSR